MTREELLTELTDAIGGMLLDAIIEGRQGLNGLLWLRAKHAQLKGLLRTKIGEAFPEPAVPQPGKPTTRNTENPKNRH